MPDLNFVQCHPDCSGQFDSVVLHFQFVAKIHHRDGLARRDHLHQLLGRDARDAQAVE